MPEDDLRQNITVYMGPRENAERFYQRLCEEGLKLILSEPFQNSYARKYIYYYTARSVLVSKEEFEKAKEVMIRWETADETHIDKLMKKLWGQEVPYVVLAFIIAAISGAMILLAYGQSSHWFLIGTVIWFVSYFGMGKIRIHLEEQKYNKKNNKADENAHNQYL